MSENLDLLKAYTPEHLELYIYRYKVGLRQTKIKIIQEHLREIKNLTVLDVGCGCGVFSDICYRQGAIVISVDFSKIMLNYVHRVNRNLLLIQASGEKLPVMSNTIDLVLALDVIEHVRHPLELLMEIHRVLREKGLLLLTTDNRRVFPTQKLLKCYKWLVSKLVKNCPELPTNPPCTHIREYSTEEILALLESAKFKVLKFRTFSEAPFFDYIHSLFSIFLKGDLQKYMWNRLFVLSVKMG